MHRGEIWWANMPEPRGSEPGYRRPVLIIQSDEFNRSGINTIVAVILTSNLNLTRAPGNVYLDKKDTGLPKSCVANISRLATIDKSFLTECAGVLPSQLLHQIENGLRLVLNLR